MRRGRTKETVKKGEAGRRRMSGRSGVWGEKTKQRSNRMSRGGGHDKGKSEQRNQEGDERSYFLRVEGKREGEEEEIRGNEDRRR